MAAASIADQSLSSLPLIHVWIPTAFLSGGFKGKSHHIYQIYLRIRDEEWNVYRRYSQFYALHKSLKARHPTVVGGFEFPPKKALGNKDSKVVQERRKKLETYLRNVLNYLQTNSGSGGGGGDHLSSKEKLVAAVPFLRFVYIFRFSVLKLIFSRSPFFSATSSSFKTGRTASLTPI